jgi:hypothetical protein
MRWPKILTVLDSYEAINHSSLISASNKILPDSDTTEAIIQYASGIC